MQFQSPISYFCCSSFLPRRVLNIDTMEQPQGGGVPRNAAAYTAPQEGYTGQPTAVHSPEQGAVEGMQEPSSGQPITSADVVGGPTASGYNMSSHQQTTGRPVADQNAFLDREGKPKPWQSEIPPTERAKQLEQEMKERSKGQRKEKTVAVGDKVMRVD